MKNENTFLSPEKTDAEQAQGVHSQGRIHRNLRRGARIGYLVEETSPREHPGSHHRNKADARQGQNLMPAKVRATKEKKNKHRDSACCNLPDGKLLAVKMAHEVNCLGHKGLKLRQTRKMMPVKVRPKKKKRRHSVCCTLPGGKGDNYSRRHSTHSISNSFIQGIDSG